VKTFRPPVWNKACSGRHVIRRQPPAHDGVDRVPVMLPCVRMAALASRLCLPCSRAPTGRSVELHGWRRHIAQPVALIMAMIVRIRTRVSIQSQPHHTGHSRLGEHANLVHELRSIHQHLRLCLADQCSLLASVSRQLSGCKIAPSLPQANQTSRNAAQLWPGPPRVRPCPLRASSAVVPTDSRPRSIAGT